MSGVTGLFNSSQEAKVARENTERQIQAQKELAEYSYAKDVEMWNRANEYNAPSAQMQRLSSAGLNPNMVYGSGSVVGNTSTQTPKYQAYNPQYNNKPIQIPDLLGILGAFQDLKIKKAQTDNVSEEVNKRRIENFFLSDLLGIKSQAGHYQNLMLRNLYGQDSFQPDYTDSAFKKSPYMQKFGTELKKTQASTSNVLQDTILKQLETNLRQKGVSSSDNLLLRMFLQSGLFEKSKGVLEKNFSF